MTDTASGRPDVAVGPLAAASFLLELTMLTVLALTGAAIGDSTPVRMLAAVALPVVAAGIWAVWMAPTSTRRLPNPRRLVVQVALFAVTGVLASAVLAPWVGAVFFAAAAGVFGALARRESRGH
ncbi:YrdB family protein [Rhodococcus sp. NPDC058505]|uniref:YrdB family protein n=1 Tax=unclassified Rhodococcus (in: high G+C Gram-positive bacteria) TaxID=192944 RepID=UPI003651EC0E